MNPGMNVIAAMRARRRLVDVGVVVFCLGLLGYALFLQYFRGLDPCPLCLFQRIAIIGLTIAYFLAALVADGWRLLRVVVSLLIGLVAIAGSGVAIRHLYIQSLPPGHAIELVAQASLGTRERVVLVRVGGHELLLGVAAGSVRTLLVLGDSVAVAADAAARAASPAASTGTAPTDTAAGGTAPPSFAAALRAVVARSFGR